MERVAECLRLLTCPLRNFYRRNIVARRPGAITERRWIRWREHSFMNAFSKFSPADTRLYQEAVCVNKIWNFRYFLAMLGGMSGGANCLDDSSDKTKKPNQGARQDRQLLNADVSMDSRAVAGEGSVFPAQRISRRRLRKHRS